MSEFLVIVCIVVGYFYWCRFELKNQFRSSLEEVKAKLSEAVGVAGSEPHGSRAKTHLYEARALMREIDEFDWQNTTDLDDLIALRKQLHLVRHEASCAIASVRSAAAKVATGTTISIFV